MVSSTTRLAPIVSIAWHKRLTQAFKILVAGLFNLAALDSDEVDGDFPLRRGHSIETEPIERSVSALERFPRRPRSRRARRFRWPRARGTPWRGSFSQTSRSAADKRGPAARKAAARNLVEPLNACRGLWQPSVRGSLLSTVSPSTLLSSGMCANRIRCETGSTTGYGVPSKWSKSARCCRSRFTMRPGWNTTSSRLGVDASCHERLSERRRAGVPKPGPGGQRDDEARTLLQAVADDRDRTTVQFNQIPHGRPRPCCA